MRCLYVIAGWCGPRRCPDARANSDQLFYLRVHLTALSNMRFKHDVLVVMPGVVNHDLNAFLNEFPRLRVSLMTRENRGLSYGSWSDAVRVYPNYDFYALVEDDYIPTVDPFRCLVPIMEREGIGLLCSYANDSHGAWHAAVTNCVVSRNAIEAASQEFGALQYGPGDVGYSTDAQVQFSQGFVRAGVVLRDYTPWYQAPFYDGKITVFGNREHPWIWIPIQMIARYELQNVD